MTDRLKELRALALQDPNRVLHSINHFVEGLEKAHAFGPAVWVSDCDPDPSHFVFREADKEIQRKIHSLLVEIYEPVFCDFSYGWRRKRNTRKAINRLLHNIRRYPPGQVCIIRTDISACFHNIPHQPLKDILDLRITDGVVRSLINQFLGSMQIVGGIVSTNKRGVLYGSTLGPILANIFLDRVLDKWFVEEFPDMQIIRYADDLVIVSEINCNAGRLLGLIDNRLREYGLNLNSNKTDLHYLGGGETLKFLGAEISNPFGKVFQIRRKKPKNVTQTSGGVTIIPAGLHQ